MRRIPSTLLLTLAAVTGGLTLAAAPAGATGTVPHALHLHAGTPRTGSHAHITSSVPPINIGYVEAIDSSGNFSYSPAGVQTPTDPNQQGSTVNFAMTATVPGFGPGTTIAVSVYSGSLTQPLQAGATYGSGGTGTVNVTIGGMACADSQNPLSAGSAVVDQIAESGSGVVSAAIQFACFALAPFQGVFGSYAYHAVPTTPHLGYYTYESNGALSSFGNDSFLNYLGDLSAFPLNQPVVGMAQTPDGGGYWMVAADGGIFAFGDAAFYGSTGAMALNKPIVGMAATRDGKGYWLVASDGGIFAFGDAAFYGSTGAMALNEPVVGMAATPDGRGYWLVASDGGIFAFGDAGFYGSTGAMSLNRPVVGMTATQDGRGYWFVASDGGIFAFGDAGYHGSTGAMSLNEPIVGMATTNDGSGYWLVASDGGIFGFNAPYYGSLPGSGLSVNDVAGLSTLPGISV